MIIINSDIKNFSKKNLCIITDFDKTLTANQSESTIGVFSKFLPEDYILAKNEINMLENYIMNNISIEETEKKHYYRNIWMLKLRLLSSYLKDDKLIKEIANSGEFIMRKNAIDCINYLKKRYKIIINSSGCANLIKEVLTCNGCDLKDILIISNYINIGFDNPIDENNLITSQLKRNNFYNKLTSNIKNCLLIGDTIEDLSMKPIGATSLSIGFLDCEYDEYLEQFNNSFDIVATENEAFDSPIKILNL